MLRRSRHGAYTLLEVVIAAVMLVIAAMGLAAAMGSAFMADSVARDTQDAAQAAQQVMEELQQLDYNSVLAQDGTAILTPTGIAIKVSVAQVMVGMAEVEVFACRPVTSQTLAVLGAMTIQQAEALSATKGSQVRLLTYVSQTSP